MERENVVEKLTEIFRQVFANDSLIITNDLTANDVGNWDSLSHMLLIAEVESGFSIKFKLKDLNKMNKVGDMIDIIISKL
jgi:acyl carrier protein